MKVYDNCCSRPVGRYGQFPEAVGAGVAVDQLTPGPGLLPANAQQSIVVGVATGTAIYLITKVLDKLLGSK
jgi:hypothetical protein